MAAKPMRRINIIGHQNPDTDSICSALAYAWLKTRGSLEGLYEARRAGHINRETRFVLQHFGVEPPRLCTDVSPQIKDIDIRKQAGIDGEMSVRAAWNLMRDVEIDTLCIVDNEGELQGLITIKDIADANMDLFDTAVLAAASTRYSNLLETLEAELLLCAQAADGPLRQTLCAMLDFVRSLIRADVLDEPVQAVRFLGLDGDGLREHSHHPEREEGQPHFLPAPEDPPILLRLNRLRTAVRQTELLACHAFSRPDGTLARPDLVKALNRLSSLCWILMIRVKRGGQV